MWYRGTLKTISNMKNIKIPKKTGNAITRHAYLELIFDSMYKVMRSPIHLELDGYENDKDRVHFTYGGKKCVLHGVFLPDLDESKPDTLAMTVFAENNKEKTLWDITVDLRDLRFKTLDRIAYEVYDYCKTPYDRDYEETIKDYIAGNMDAYREFMS